MIRYAVELGRALAAFDDIELHVLARPEAAESLGAILGLPSHQMHVLQGNVLSASVRQRAGSLEIVNQVDVVHGTKHLVPRRTSGVRLLTVHDLLPLDRPRDFGVLKRALLPRAYLASIRDADVLVCVSEATRRRLVAHVPHAAHRATVVPLAVSSTLVTAPSEAMAEAPRGPFALVVGDASPRKNLRFLTQIWPAVRARRPDLVLAVAGPAGWGVDDGLEALDELVEVGAAVRLGHVRDEQLKWAYEQAAIVLCPSRLEGFGLPALEAVTFGAPVVSSPDPALAEASRGRARVVALDDPLGWVEAIVTAVKAGRQDPDAHVRMWNDVARETVAAVRGRRD